MNKPAAFVAGALSLVLIGAITVVVLRTEPTPNADVESSNETPANEQSSKGLLESLGSGTGQFVDNSFGEFLDPALAFKPSARSTQGGDLEIEWDIADDYYLYKDKFQFRILEPAGVTVGSPNLPPAKIKEDEFFGRMEVYYQHVLASMPVVYESGRTDALKVEVGYQGCADAGLCYPPMTKTLDVALPTSAPGGIVTVPQSSEPTVIGAQYSLPSVSIVSEQDRIAGALASGTLWLTVLTFYGFGLLLAFTPCVLPMLPILSSIIVGHGNQITTRRAFLLSLTFVLAMAAAYTTAGVVAGLSGANLQILFQQPWILVTFSGLFVLLALAMFGLYELQLPVSWQSRLTTLCNRQRGGDLVGVGIMGLLSALIVGPCVAAPLAGALIYISQTGDGALGGLALFAMSMGMGTPMLALGASAGRWLPKAGAWMVQVKSAFGFVLLGLAIYMLERLLPGWIIMLLWGALFIYAAVFVGALDSLPTAVGGWRRLGKATGMILLAYGMLLLVGAAGGGEDPFRPLRGVGPLAQFNQTLAKLNFKPVKGLTGLQTELTLAGASQSYVMLDFYADWCVTCKELERDTFSDPEVRTLLRDTVLLQSDVTANDTEDQTLLTELGLFGPPAILFFGPDGDERRPYRVIGFMDAESFSRHLRAALAS